MTVIGTQNPPLLTFRLPKFSSPDSFRRPAQLSVDVANGMHSQTGEMALFNIRMVNKSLTMEGMVTREDVAMHYSSFEPRSCGLVSYTV